MFIDLDLSNHTDRQKAFLDCHKQWAMVNILFGRGARISCIDVAEKLLKKAIEYEFNEIVVDVAKLLRLHFGGMAGDRKKYQWYKEGQAYKLIEGSPILEFTELKEAD